MSDENLPLQPADSPDVPPMPQANWFVGWDDFAADAQESTEPTPDATAAEITPVAEPAEPVPSFMAEASSASTDEPVFDPPQNIGTTPAAPPSWVEHATPHASIDLPAWHEASTPAPRASETPDVADLISLIQELNQCNNALLDRVSQLEEALEQASKARPALVSVMGDDERAVQMQQMAHDLEETRSHATQLFEQLEAAHQSSKRQQILTETLSEQLQNSQERVAQLERECALTQQKYNDQTQLLAQSELARRDLSARLQRQQRYTLQFKAALEKCLEVSPSSMSTILEAIEAQPLSSSDQGATGLPKVHRIRPWSSQSDSQFLDKMSDIMEYGESSLDEEPVPLFDDGFTSDATVSTAPVEEPQTASPPVLQLPTGLNTSATVVNALTPADNTVSYNLKGDRTPDAPGANTTAPELGLSPEVIKAGVEELQAALNDLWGGQPPIDLPQDAEATLWEDLARLIDVSSDDLLKATFTAESADLGETLDLEPLTAQATPEAIATPVEAAPSYPATPSMGDRGSASKAPFLANPSWPSPLVHPLRRPRKLPSLAAVELPRFAN